MPLHRTVGQESISDSSCTEALITSVLPLDLQLHILTFCSVNDLLHFALCNSYTYQLVFSLKYDTCLWRQIALNHYGIQGIELHYPLYSSALVPDINSFGDKVLWQKTEEHFWKKCVMDGIYRWNIHSLQKKMKVSKNLQIISMTKMKWDTIRTNIPLQRMSIHCWEYLILKYDYTLAACKCIFTGVQGYRYDPCMDKEILVSSFLHCATRRNIHTGDIISVRLDLQNLDPITRTGTMEMFLNSFLFKRLNNIPYGNTYYYPAISLFGKHTIRIKRGTFFQLRNPKGILTYS